MKRIGVLFEAKKKSENGKPDKSGRDKKPSYWRTVHGQHIGFDGDPPNGRPVIGPKQITRYLMVPRDESVEEGVFFAASKHKDCGCGCGDCGGGLSEASVAKMNRKAKKKMAKLKPNKNAKPYASLSKQEKQRVLAIMEKEAKANKVEFDKKNVTLVYEQEPYDAYDGLPNEVEYTVSCGGSGENDFESSAFLDGDYAAGGVRLTFTPYLVGYDQVVYELESSESIGGGDYDDSYAAEQIGDVISAHWQGGSPFDKKAIEALVAEYGPDLGDVVYYFTKMHQDDEEADCPESRRRGGSSSRWERDYDYGDY